jgi:hypothetical protein
MQAGQCRALASEELRWPHRFAIANEAVGMALHQDMMPMHSHGQEDNTDVATCGATST